MDMDQSLCWAYKVQKHTHWVKYWFLSLQFIYLIKSPLERKTNHFVELKGTGMGDNFNTSGVSLFMPLFTYYEPTLYFDLEVGHISKRPTPEELTGEAGVALGWNTLQPSIVMGTQSWVTDLQLM